MFEGLGLLHEVARVSAWTGLSAGALAACVALGWFVAAARPVAIAGAVAVAAAYGGLLYGDHSRGAADKVAWDDAVAAAAEQAKARDAAIGKAAADKYDPVVQELARQADGLKRQVDLDEKKMLAAKIGAGGDACVVGADAVRLRKSHGR